MDLKIYTKSSATVLETQDGTKYIVPAQSHIIRRSGDVFEIFSIEETRHHKHLFSEIKDEAGADAGVDADAVQTYLTSKL